MEMDRKTSNVLNYLIIPICVTINLAGYQLSQILRLPILVDSIGTILAGALGGPLVGIYAGILSTTVNSMINPISFAYIMTSVSIGFLAALFSRFSFFKHIYSVFLAGLLLSFCTTILSGIVTFFVFGGATGGTSSIATATLYALGTSLLKSVFSVQLIQEMMDKVISIFIVYFILKVLPNRFLIKFNDGERLIDEK